MKGNINEVVCKGKVYEVTNERLNIIEETLENAEDTIREHQEERLEERYENMKEEAEERTRQAYKALHGAALDSVVSKALKDLRQTLEAEAEKSVQMELEDLKESLLNE